MALTGLSAWHAHTDIHTQVATVVGDTAHNASKQTPEVYQDQICHSDPLSDEKKKTPPWGASMARLGPVRFQNPNPNLSIWGGRYTTGGKFPFVEIFSYTVQTGFYRFVSKSECRNMWFV